MMQCLVQVKWKLHSAENAISKKITMGASVYVAKAYLYLLASLAIKLKQKSCKEKNLAITALQFWIGTSLSTFFVSFFDARLCSFKIFTSYHVCDKGIAAPYFMKTALLFTSLFFIRLPSKQQRSWKNGCDPSERNFQMLTGKSFVWNVMPTRLIWVLDLCKFESDWYKIFLCILFGMHILFFQCYFKLLNLRPLIDKCQQKACCFSWMH